MRPASKQIIAMQLTAFDKWKSDMQPLVAEIKVSGALAVIEREFTEVRERISKGEIGACTRAHIRSVMRIVEDFRSGFYVGVSDGGAFICKSYCAA